MNARVGDIIETKGPDFTVGEITHEGPSELFGAEQVMIDIFRTDGKLEIGDALILDRSKIARIWREKR